MILRWFKSFNYAVVCFMIVIILYIVAMLINDARKAVFMEAGLSFLGISDPTIISWGKMMQHALQYTYLDVWKWWLLPPGFSLSFIIMAFSFVGYGLESVLNPRLRKGAAHVRY